MQLAEKIYCSNHNFNDSRIIDENQSEIERCFGGLLELIVSARQFKSMGFRPRLSVATDDMRARHASPLQVFHLSCVGATHGSPGSAL